MKATLNTNESGFTLLESLISLMVSSIILLFLYSSITQLAQMNRLIIEESQSVSSAKNKITTSRQIEWHLFLTQLEHYLKGTELIEINSKEIIVNEKDKKNHQTQRIRYGQARTGNQNFYRSKNNGYNELLTEILDYKISRLDYWLVLSFTFRNQEKYEGRIWVESWREKEEKSLILNQKKVI